MSTSKNSDSQSAQQVMMVQSLRKTPMFSGLASSVLESLASGCHLQKVAKDSYIFHEGQQVDGFYVIHHGAINVHKVTESGREQVIRVFYPGESLGEVVIAGDNTYPASAKATERSQVILIPTNFFRTEIQRDPDLAMCVLASMSMHLRYLVETVEGLKLKQAESRVAQWLLRELEAHGEAVGVPPEITLPLAKHLLASQLGISSETLSRVFARLRDAALISIEGKRIAFLDVAGLREFLIHGETAR